MGLLVRHGGGEREGAGRKEGRNEGSDRRPACPDRAYAPPSRSVKSVPALPLRLRRLGFALPFPVEEQRN